MTDNVTNTAEANQQPSLSVTDLFAVAEIIQISSTRGAFRADELAKVGTIYNKLIAFLNSADAINKQADAGGTV